MESLAFFILRLSVGIVFLMTAYKIMQNPMSWGKSIKPWAAKLLPFSKQHAMIMTALFDVGVGLWIITGISLWVSALLGALHMLQVLITVGIEGPEYRDIAILGACLFLLLVSLPSHMVPF